MKIDLVIQGPMLSPGVSGNGKYVEFECTNNINKTIDLYGKLFENIVLVTWKGQDVSKIQKYNNLKILEIEDIGGDFKNSSNKFWKTENYKRQFYSTYMGLKYLKNNNLSSDFIFKLRTDQTVDFNLLKTELAKNIDNNKIYIPAYVLSSAIYRTYPVDYFFVSNYDIMEEFLLSQIHAAYGFFNAHESMLFNYYPKNLYPKNEFSVFKRVLNSLFWSDKTRVNNLYQRFDTFSQDLYVSCEWRGNFVKTTQNIFFGNSNQTNQDGISFKMRYLNFKRFVQSYMLNYSGVKKRMKQIELLINKN